MPKLHRQWQSGVAGTDNEGVCIGDGMLGRDGEDCNSDDSGDIGDGWGGVAAGEDNRGKSGRDVRGESWRLPMPTTSPIHSSLPSQHYLTALLGGSEDINGGELLVVGLGRWVRSC
jgi:hypothetical protein